MLVQFRNTRRVEGKVLHLSVTSYSVDPNVSDVWVIEVSPPMGKPEKIFLCDAGTSEPVEAFRDEFSLAGE